GRGDRRRRPNREDGGSPARHRQGHRPRGRGLACGDRGGPRPAAREPRAGEEPPPIEALLLIAADAISAARPGARRETLDAYIKRLEKLEEIANSFKGVQQSYAIQAGREVRILVRPEQIDDTAAQLMARDIAKRIESELSFPGQIRVTVVRETRAIEYAK